MTTTASRDYTQCPYCGIYHVGMCPRIKEIEYHPLGQIKRIVFHPTLEVADEQTDR